MNSIIKYLILMSLGLISANKNISCYREDHKTTENMKSVCEFSSLLKQCNQTRIFRTDEKQSKKSEDISKSRAEGLLLKEYFESIPLLRSNDTVGISHDCMKQINIYTSDLNHLKLWALKMYDSSAKIPSGLLNGNVNQYGDFDQCLHIESNHDKDSIQGKYCLTSFQISLKDDSVMKDADTLLHSHHAFKSEMSDPGHRIPRFSSITWGICIPNACTSNDLQTILEDKLNLHSSAIDIQILVEEKMCQRNKMFKISKGIVFTLLFFIGFLLVVIYSTIYDDPSSCFSLRRTLSSLFSLERIKDDIKAVHGIRCLNALMLIISHKSMAIFFYPYMNRTEMAQNLGDFWSVIGRAASLYTDPFIMFSGLLTCYSIMGKIDKNKSINVFREYTNRLTRLIPTLTALILFCTWILPTISSGPQWPLVIEHHSEICKKYWWRNFLFIHNYFGFENMCLTHTHHIGIDTQLFIIGVPLIIWMGLNKKYAKYVLGLLLVLAMASTCARFYVSYTMNLANYVHFGASVQQLFRTADYMYILPPHRFTVYVMGIFLAILLRHKPKQRISKKHLAVGWMVSTLLFIASFFGPSAMSCMSYKYNSFHNALFAAFGPIGWCGSFAWIIYTTHHGYSSIIGELLSWRGFIIWTRLSYAVYLTQFPIFFYNVGSTRTPDHYQFLGAMLNSGELMWIMFSSVLMTLIFDLPFQKLKNLYLKQ